MSCVRVLFASALAALAPLAVRTRGHFTGNDIKCVAELMTVFFSAYALSLAHTNDKSKNLRGHSVKLSNDTAKSTISSANRPNGPNQSIGSSNHNDGSLAVMISRLILHSTVLTIVVYLTLILFGAPVTTDIIATWTCALHISLRAAAVLLVHKASVNGIYKPLVYDLKDAVQKFIDGLSASTLDPVQVAGQQPSLASQTDNKAQIDHTDRTFDKAGADGTEPVSSLICDWQWTLLMGLALGAWLGAVPIPLDWDRPWQKWPNTIIRGCEIGFDMAIIVALARHSVKQ